MDKISINDEEARAYTISIERVHVANRDHAPRDPDRGADSDRGVNVAEDDAARDRAEEVRKRLLAGEPFRGWRARC